MKNWGGNICSIWSLFGWGLEFDKVVGAGAEAE